MTAVVRDSQIKEVKVEELVVGDVVIVKGGDRVPADIRLVEAHGFKVLFLI